MTPTEKKAFDGKLQGIDMRNSLIKEIWSSTKWPQNIFDMPYYWLEFRRLEKTKAAIAFEKFKAAGLSPKDNELPIYEKPDKKGAPGKMCCSSTMYVRASDPNYQRCLHEMELSMMTGKAAGGFPTDPWYGKKYKPLATVSVTEIRKAIIVSAPNPPKKATKSQVATALNLEPVASSPHCICKDCKALDALAHANAVIDKLVK